MHQLNLENRDHAREIVRETLKLDPASEYDFIFGALLARFEWRDWAFSSVAVVSCGGQFILTGGG
jgi:hypothetical protein